MHGEERLKSLRGEIDKADSEIIRLLAGRFAAAKRIGEIKRQLGMELLQSGRELEVIERVRKAAKASGISEDFAERLFRGIMAESRSMQKQQQKQNDQK